MKSNKTLSIVFVALILVVAFLYFGDGIKKEKTFRDELVKIDTSEVSEIIISPKAKPGTEVKLFKDSDSWKVALNNGKNAGVPKAKIHNLFQTLLKVKPLRLAARDESKWDDYQVTDQSTRVRVMEDGDETLNLIIGKFSFQQPRTMNTFVRLAQDTDVYEVEGFLEMQFNQEPNSFRDNSILSESKDSWKSLRFDYPADSSFFLAKVNENWTVDGNLADSAKTHTFFNSLARLTSTNFVDYVDGGKPVYKLTIEKEDNSLITISAIQSDSLLIINSSHNPESYFDAGKNGLKEKIFVGKNKFLK